MRRHLAHLIAVVPIVLLAILPACGTDSSTEPPPAGPARLTAHPPGGPPGTLVAVETSGVTATDAGELSARFGELDAPVAISASGQLVTVVPLLAAGADGTSPPGAPVGIEIRVGDAVVARTDDAFAVEALPPAPDAAEEMATALAEMTASLRILVDDLEPAPSEAEGIATAVLAACDSLLDGDGESLSAAVAALADEHPEMRALLDGFVASSGMLDASRQLADAVAQVTWESRGAEAREGVDTSDLELARKMQFHVLLRLFGETVIHETAEEYAFTVGLATGAIGIGTSVPGAAVVSAIVAVADFAVNKILLGLFPSELTGFELTLDDPDLALGETTLARIDVTARNTPPGVGIQDFVGLTLNLLGLGGSSADTFAEILENTAAFYLSTVQSGLAAYASAHPELGLDVSFAVVPEMTWEAVVHDPRLVERLTLTPDIIQGLEDAVDWEAGGPNLGEGRIYARVATGDDAMLIDPLPGFEYTGGAFGEGAPATETHPVLVVSDLFLDVDFAATIAEDGFNVLGVTAGYLDVDGDPQGAPGLDVELIVDGGMVEEATGVTDESGQFATLAQLSPGSDAILITVTVSDATGQELVETVEASVTSGSVVIGRYVAVTNASADAIEDDTDGDVAVETPSGSLDAAASASWSSEQETSQTNANASGSSSLTWSFAFEGESLVGITASVSASAEVSASYSGDAGTYFEVTGTGNARIGVPFEVVGGPVAFDLVATGDDGLRVDLEDADGDLLHEEGPSHDYTLVLEPGEYDLAVRTGARAHGIINGTEGSAADDDTAGFELTVSFQ